MDKETLEHLRTKLESERDRVLAELQAIATPNSTTAGQWDAVYPKFETHESGSEADRDDEEDEVEEYEERVAAKSSLASQLLEITHALERMDQGSYGSCKTCRNPIPLERLKANPAAEYDMEHEPEYA